jgi:2-keto-4-pentenoate hydratase
MGKETVKEAAEEFANNCTLISDAAAFEGFIEGAKWQQEQMEKLKDFEVWKEWKNTGVIKYKIK